MGDMTVAGLARQRCSQSWRTDRSSIPQTIAKGTSGRGNLKPPIQQWWNGRSEMGTRRATVIRVDDAATFVIRPNMAVKLAVIEPPPRGTPEAAKAKERLESLVLGKRIEFETLEWDRLGRSIASVTVGDTDINKVMKEFLKTP